MEKRQIKKPRKTIPTAEAVSMMGAEWATKWCATVSAEPDHIWLPFEEQLHRQLCTITPTRRGDFESSAKAILKLRYDQLVASGVPEYLFVAWEGLDPYGRWEQIAATAGELYHT